VMASEGYPADPKIDRRIDGLGTSEAGRVFHAGTVKRGPYHYTCSGRVLIAAAAGVTSAEAVAMCYDVCSNIHFEGCQYRRDIGGIAKPERSAERVAGE
jgi:phosphoribosylamine--glycine ligase